MRWSTLAIGLLCSLLIHPSWAQDTEQPTKTQADYFKVEIRGTLQVDVGRDEHVSPLGLAFRATVLDMALSFGDNKNLAAIAEKLDGKTVLVSGDLVKWSPRTAGPPSQHIHYVRVTALKAAE